MCAGGRQAGTETRKGDVGGAICHRDEQNCIWARDVGMLFCPEVRKTFQTASKQFIEKYE